MTSLHTLQLLAAYFQPDPLEFCAERWQGLKTGWSDLPFGAGPRNCAGQNLALTEVAYVLARMAQEFRAVECRDDVVEWVGELNDTARSRNGILVGFFCCLFKHVNEY
jgi:cytochrome P450